MAGAKRKSATTAKDAKSAIEQMQKLYGKDAIFVMDKMPIMKVPTFTSSSLAIDHALGCGGIPRGRIIEVYGLESSGKTTLALHILASAQKQALDEGKFVAFIDVEHALDKKYAGKLGIDTNEMLFSQPDYAEQALDMVIDLAKTGQCTAVVLDSVAALVPKAELDGGMEDNTYALQARKMSQAMRKMTAIVSKSETSIIFINQVREKIGVLFGDKKDTPAGKALKFYSSVRMEVKRIKTLKDTKGEVNVANSCIVKVAKNKLAPPLREAEIKIVFGKGIDMEHDLFVMGAKYGYVKKSGAMYKLPPKLHPKTIKGANNFLKFLSVNEEVAARLRSAILKKMKAELKAELEVGDEEVNEKPKRKKRTKTES